MGHHATPDEGDPILAEVRRFYETHHDGIERSRLRHDGYYETLTRALRARIPEGQRVLDLGCGAGHLLARLRPSRGVGIDISAPAIADARRRYGDAGLDFLVGDIADADILTQAGGPFDAIILVNVATHLTDVQAAFEAFAPLCHAETRIFVYSYSRLWQPLLRVAEFLHLKFRQPPEAWLPPEELVNLLRLADFEVVRRDRQVILPLRIPLVSGFLNRYVGHLPLFDILSLMFGMVARPNPARFSASKPAKPTVSVVIPCRNEAGHVGPLVERLPSLPSGSEFVFVEGNSLDDTYERIERAVREHPDLPLRLVKQPGRGKGDAVRTAFVEAKGDILLILDSDMGVAPEDVPRFVRALAQGKGELVNGSRLVYPMEGEAMRFFNLVANKSFALLFSWILGQQVRDTLCGTKALWRRDYLRIAENRHYFGDFDPFGDFDLLFGASRLSLRIVDLPVRYHERTYGKTNISRWRHGWLLLKMSLFAARKLKFV